MQLEKLDILIREVEKIGEQVKKAYFLGTELQQHLKSDNSPVTFIDNLVNDRITELLIEEYPYIPIISEENINTINLNILQSKKDYWLIDPIDGTKSLIKKQGDFTINIALMHNNYPVFGLIYQPITEIMYYTNSGFAYKKNKNNLHRIEIDKNISAGIRLIKQRRKGSAAVDKLIKDLKPVVIDQAASSIKFCLVAEGKYHIYPNFSNINTWDIAAGHAIVNAAGGHVFNTNMMKYEYSSSDFNSGGFIVSAINY